MTKRCGGVELGGLSFVQLSGLYQLNVILCKGRSWGPSAEVTGSSVMRVGASISVMRTRHGS